MCIRCNDLFLSCSISRASLICNKSYESVRYRTENTSSMAGKRPRSLSRTVSVSQLGSRTLSQEFPAKNPIEDPVPVSSPRIVVGFDPKPFETSPPYSPRFHEKSSSPRSVLNSLFSRHQRKVSDGVGLGIALAEGCQVPNVVVPVVGPWEKLVVHQRRHSNPIPTLVRDAGVAPQRKECNQERAEFASMEPVDRRDAFVVGEAPARESVVTEKVVTVSSHFLEKCSLCKRHLPEDQDIFMYRGDKAFCSLECRSQQMILDEYGKSCSLQGAAVASSRCAPVSFVAAG